MNDESTMFNWQEGCKDAMWSMFWMRQESAQERHEGVEADKKALKANVARLIRMTSQKTAGQRKKKNDINWDALTPTIMNIVCCATSLCLSGELGEMRDLGEKADGRGTQDGDVGGCER